MDKFPIQTPKYFDQCIVCATICNPILKICNSRNRPRNFMSCRWKEWLSSFLRVVRSNALTYFVQKSGSKWSQSNNAKFNPELANVRVHSFNTILWLLLWLLPAQPNFHSLKSSTILVRWQFIYKLYTKSKQTLEMPTTTAI